jgi:cold shock CspA family protein
MGDPVSRTRPHLGRVTSYDTERGLGTVTSDEGREFPFHAVSIADGSRQIDAGTRVAFVIAAGLGGRLEARGLVPT